MKISLYIIVIVFVLSCAQVVAPTGGKQDITPPTLVNSFPENRTRNFSGQELELTFDELVEASTINSNLFIVPNPPGNYETKVKNNVVKIKFDKPFDENTTYTFNFTNSIKDLTERNPAKNLKIVLSTGNEIDSLKISGTVKNIFTKEPVLDCTVALYPSDTLEMSKRKPLYFVKTDSSGNYEIENIKSNKYFLFAFTDKNNNLRFDQKEEYMAFLSDSLDLKSSMEIPELEIYPANNTRNKVKRVISRESEFVIMLEKNIYDLQVKYENAESNKLSYTIGNSMLNFHQISKLESDTAHATIIVRDSLLVSDTLTQKIYFKEPTGRKRKNEILNISSTIPNGREMVADLVYHLSFERPIVRLNEEKIIFKTDTLEKEKLQIEKIDNHNIKLSIQTKAKKEVELFIPSNTFENNLGDTNNVFQLKNPILHSEQTGIIEGETTDKESHKIAILQSEDRSKELQKIVFKKDFKFINIIPGNYHIKVIFDENENGIWDPGNINNLNQPEKILSTIQPIRVRANFEIKQLIE